MKICYGKPHQQKISGRALTATMGWMNFSGGLDLTLKLVISSLTGVLISGLQ
jgi:hypothetical protein